MNKNYIDSMNNLYISQYIGVRVDVQKAASTYQIDDSNYTLICNVSLFKLAANQSASVVLSNLLNYVNNKCDVDKETRAYVTYEFLHQINNEINMLRDENTKLIEKYNNERKENHKLSRYITNSINQ